MVMMRCDRNLVSMVEELAMRLGTHTCTHSHTPTLSHTNTHDTLTHSHARTHTHILIQAHIYTKTHTLTHRDKQDLSSALGIKCNMVSDLHQCSAALGHKGKIHPKLNILSDVV